MTTQDYRTRRPLRIFLSYFRPHRGLFLLDITCAFFIAVIDLAFPLISRTAMYHWLPEKQFSIFFTVMALVVVAFVLRAGLYFIVGYWGHTFGILVEADIRRDLFRHMQELDCRYFDRNRTGVLMSRLTSELFEITELAHHGPEDIFISRHRSRSPPQFSYFRQKSAPSTGRSSPEKRASIVSRRRSRVTPRSPSRLPMAWRDIRSLRRRTRQT